MKKYYSWPLLAYNKPNMGPMNVAAWELFEPTFIRINSIIGYSEEAVFVFHLHNSNTYIFI